MMAFYEPTAEQVAYLSGPWSASYSGGKDSTGLVTWVEWLRRYGHIDSPRPKLVQCDTTVEDVRLAALSAGMMDLLRRRGWECVVVRPEVHERLYCQILGRGMTPIHPGVRRMRWCTRSTKTDPMDRGRRTMGDAGLSLIGLRLGESTMRDGKLKRRGCASGGECGIPDPDERSKTPILHWTTCQLIDWLNGRVGKSVRETMADVFALTRQLVDIHDIRINQGGFDFVEPEISAARFGCIGCPAISSVREAPRSVVRRNGAGSPLNELYDVWFEARRRRNRLVRLKPNGAVGYGPIRLEVRKLLFARVMDIQRRAGVTLITPEDEAFIRDCWARKVYPRGWSEADELTEPPHDAPLFPGDSVRAKRRDTSLVAAACRRTKTTVGDFFTVRLGVRGTGSAQQKRTLILSDDEFRRLAPTAKEQRFFRPIADVITNGIIRPSEYLFYPYGTATNLLLETEEALASAVPKFYNEVLVPARSELDARKSRYRKWWEPSRPVATWLAARGPRLVTQQFGKKGNFAFDDIGRYAVVNGHAWCWKRGTPETDVLFAYLALANSRVFERLLRVYCPRIGGRQFDLAARFVHSVPLPALTARFRKLTRIGQRIHSGDSYNEAALDAAVLRAYGIQALRRRRNEQATEGTVRPLAAGSLQERFDELASRWIRETAHLSNPKTKFAHESYKEILGMGQAAIPLILAELKRRRGQWFQALVTLTGSDPVSEEQQGDLPAMTKAWLKWGRTQGFEL